MSDRSRPAMRSQTAVKRGRGRARAEEGTGQTKGRGARGKKKLRISNDGHQSLVATRVYEAEEAARAQARAKAARRSNKQAQELAPTEPSGHQQVKRTRPQRQLVLFFSTHGGTGSTTIATALGMLLARRGLTTCLLDLDLQFGDALTVLDLRPRCPISEAMMDLGHRDPGELVDRLPRHSSGLSVLSQVGYIEDLARVSKKQFPEFLGHARKGFDVLLVDGVRDFNDHAIAVLDVADEVIVITTQEILALRGLALRLEVFARLGVDADQLTVVLSRFAGNRHVPLSAIVETLRVEPRFTVRDDPKAAHGALKAGLPLPAFAPRSRAVQDIEAIAEYVAGAAPAEAGGLLARIFGGRR